MGQDNRSIKEAIELIEKVTKEANFCCNASMDTEDVLVSLERVIKILQELKREKL